MAEDRTEVKEAPPTQPSFKEYLRRKGHDVSELQGSIEKQRFIRETRSLEGMTPTPKEELKRENLVKLAAKLEGATEEKVEQNLKARQEAPVTTLKPTNPDVVETPPIFSPIESKHSEALGGAAALREAETAAKQLEKEEEQRAQKAVERARAKIRGREIMRQAEMAKQAAIAEAKRPKSLEEMAASRRGNLAEKAVNYHIREAKETGPLPPLQPREPQETTPKAEEVIRQELQPVPAPPRETGLKGLIKRIFARS